MDEGSKSLGMMSLGKKESRQEVTICFTNIEERLLFGRESQRILGSLGKEEQDRRWSVTRKLTCDPNRKGRCYDPTGGGAGEEPLPPGERGGLP